MPRCNKKCDVTLQLGICLFMVHLLTIKVLLAINLYTHVLPGEVGIHQTMPQPIALYIMLNIEGLAEL
jgi:hypothetical protein